MLEAHLGSMNYGQENRAMYKYVIPQVRSMNQGGKVISRRMWTKCSKSRNSANLNSQDILAGN